MDNTKLKSRLHDKVQELPAPETGEKALAVVVYNYLALNKNALEIIRANLKNQPLSFELFDMIKSPSGGSTVFSVPGMAGDEPEKPAKKKSIGKRKKVGGNVKKMEIKKKLQQTDRHKNVPFSLLK